MKKAHKKALKFAYHLMSGEFAGRYLPYVVGHWIEPDRAPNRSYLNEEIFVELLMRDYFESISTLRSDKVYLYRITRAGCEAMGWDYPLAKATYKNGHHKIQKARHLPPRWHPPTLRKRGQPQYHASARDWFLSRRKKT
jgi:hypothetical protein